MVRNQLVALGIVAIVWTAKTISLWAGPPVLEIQLQSSIERGVPIFWGEERSILIHSDGHISSLLRNRMKSFRLTENAFTPTTVPETRAILQKEFGPNFQVVTGGNYVVVAQGNAGEKWLRRFADLEAAFLRYFSTRGFQLNAPEFPLVAIVFPNQSEFMEYALRREMGITNRTLGLYSPMTNRMVLFEQEIQDEISTLSTILHESTHQLAFNCGVHQRLSDIPIWTAEGLASVFEAPAMLESSDRSQASRRLNPVRFSTWQQMAGSQDHIVDVLKNLVISDGAFDVNADQAYSVSWALSFYLAERDPDSYVSYMKHLSNRRAGIAYSPGARRKDFEKYLGANYESLTGNMLRFLKEIAPR